LPGLRKGRNPGLFGKAVLGRIMREFVIEHLKGKGLEVDTIDFVSPDNWHKRTLGDHVLTLYIKVPLNRQRGYFANAARVMDKLTPEATSEIVKRFNEKLAEVSPRKLNLIGTEIRESKAQWSKSLPKVIRYYLFLESQLKPRD
jgi:hypothetical protein